MNTVGLLEKYELFLSKLVLEPMLYKNKTVEIDLKGSLNPSTLLDNLFFKKKERL